MLAGDDPAPAYLDRFKASGAQLTVDRPGTARLLGDWRPRSAAADVGASTSGLRAGLARAYAPAHAAKHLRRSPAEDRGDATRVCLG